VVTNTPQQPRYRTGIEADTLEAGREASPSLARWSGERAFSALRTSARSARFWSATACSAAVDMAAADARGRGRGAAAAVGGSGRGAGQGQVVEAHHQRGHRIFNHLPSCQRPLPPCL